MKTLVIINPTSGQHRAEQQIDHITPILMSIGGEMHYTEKAGDAEQYAKEASSTGDYTTIVAAGGDGTINEVINGILTADGSSDRPSVGLIPMGTSNILATELGIPHHAPEDAVQIIKAKNSRKIDIGLANGRYFTMMASFGCDAEAVKRVNPIVKDLVGAPAYLLSGVAALAEYRASAIDINIDGANVHSDAFIVVVANTSSYALEQVKVAPFASIDDGWLDICIFEKPPNDKIGFVGQLLLLMARRHLGDPRVRYYRGKKVSITADPPILGQIDGDLWSKTPVTLDILSRAISFYVP